MTVKSLCYSPPFARAFTAARVRLVQVAMASKKIRFLPNNSRLTTANSSAHAEL
jgi:hypothetical protein